MNRVKQHQCPFCEGSGLREDQSQCTSCLGGRFIYIGEDGNFTDKPGNKPRGIWFGKFELLDLEGVPDYAF